MREASATAVARLIEYSTRPLTVPVTPISAVTSSVVVADFWSLTTPPCASPPSSDSSTSQAASMNGFTNSTFTAPRPPRHTAAFRGTARPVRDLRRGNAPRPDPSLAEDTRHPTRQHRRCAPPRQPDAPPSPADSLSGLARDGTPPRPPRPQADPTNAVARRRLARGESPSPVPRPATPASVGCGPLTPPRPPLRARPTSAPFCPRRAGARRHWLRHGRVHRPGVPGPARPRTRWPHAARPHAGAARTVGGRDPAGDLRKRAPAPR